MIIEVRTYDTVRMCQLLSNGNILIVEDEEKLARVISLELEYDGYSVKAVHDGTVGLAEAESSAYDLILLDIMLPGMSGLELLRRLRRRDPYTPVILLTARDEVPDKVSGLDLGANDYVTKPFQTEELLARIRAHLRPVRGAFQEEHLSCGDLSVNVNTREVKRQNQTISVTPREFDLLVYLLKNQNHVLTREQLLNHVWGFDYYGETNVVDVYIRYLRKKIDQPFDNPLIHTVRGVGYTLKEPEQ